MPLTEAYLGLVGVLLHPEVLWCGRGQNEVPVTQQIDLSSMPIDDSYDGPRMEGVHSCSDEE